jgi:CRP-like cAMP-binding protein
LDFSCIEINPKKDITVRFTFPYEFASGYDSFLTKTPSAYQIEALSDSILWTLNEENLQPFYKHTEAGNKMGRILSEKLYINKCKRLTSLLTESPEERYIHLMSEQPRFIQLIPLKYIASYIGIIPQALSRIRRRIY